jgi:hypothetical protein
MISCTGKPIRGTDPWGNGHYGASRGGSRIHLGSDFECKPGQHVVMPITGTVIRVARPYLSSDFSGLLIQNCKIVLKMFYFTPELRFIGQTLPKGHFIGIAQDISKRYEGMIPHIHVQVESIDPSLLLDIP